MEEKEKQRYDFYYSDKIMEQKSMELGGGITWDGRRQPKTNSFFKGVLYTEMIRHGKTPVTNWAGDLIFLGTGTNDDIEIKPY